MEEKGYLLAKFIDAEWMCDLAFLFDNTCSQGLGEIINGMVDRVKAFLVNYLFEKNR